MKRKSGPTAVYIRTEGMCNESAQVKSLKPVGDTP